LVETFHRVTRPSDRSEGSQRLATLAELSHAGGKAKSLLINKIGDIRRGGAQLRHVRFLGTRRGLALARLIDGSIERLRSGQNERCELGRVAHQHGARLR
jgi:hypothetical protein